jgi:hypothetical protein
MREALIRLKIQVPNLGISGQQKKIPSRDSCRLERCDIALIMRPNEFSVPDDGMKFAVCQRVELASMTRLPIFFKSSRAANRFVDANVTPSLRAESLFSRRSIKQVRRERDASRRRRGKERAKVAASSGALAVLSYGNLFLPTHRGQGWVDPVPIQKLSDHQGTSCPSTFREFFPISRVGSTPGLSLSETIDRDFDLLPPDPACYLAGDWDFEQINADFRQRPANSSELRQDTMEVTAITAVHDLEGALRKFYPEAPASAVFDFWRSWQVRRALARFCYYLARFRNAQRSVNESFDAGQEGKTLLLMIFRELETFTHGIASEPDSGQLVTVPREQAVPDSARSVEDDQGTSTKTNHLHLFKQILKQTSVEKWAECHKIGRTTVFDWQAARKRGEVPKGKVSAQMCAEIERAIEKDAIEFGLPTRTNSD